MEKILNTVFALIEDEGSRQIIIGVFLTLVAVGTFLLILRLTTRLLQKAHSKLDLWRGTRIPPIRIQSYEMLSSDRFTDLLKTLVKAVRIVALALILYIFVPLILSFFPWTRGLVAKYFPYIVAPFSYLFQEFVAFIPNLFFIAVIVFITRYILKFTKAFFSEIQKGNIVFPKFHVEWVDPTAKLLRLCIIIFAVVLISPYLPGFGSPAFQGISIFFGVLLSLGSTAAISNIIAGATLVYTQSFNVGDRVKIADTTGDIVEKTMLITRIRTLKNVEVTIPNAMVLGSHIINFSTLARESGLILHTSVTIGYDVPWRKVHEMLLQAGCATNDVLKDPAPFVLQIGLNDYSVTYELNVHISEVAKSAKILSELYQNIQDNFNEAGIEILSPSYAALRDGNEPVIPEDYLPKTFAPRGFRFFSPKTLKGHPEDST
jgi:small-conductance mechanosensitive channel